MIGTLETSAIPTSSLQSAASVRTGPVPGGDLRADQFLWSLLLTLRSGNSQGACTAHRYREADSPHDEKCTVSLAYREDVRPATAGIPVLPE